MARFEQVFAGRADYDRSGQRYPSDLTNEEWTLIEKIIPPAKRGGNKRTIDIRRVVDGLVYVLSTGCQWTAIPKDLPPRTTLNDYFRRWDYDGTLVRIHRALCGTGHASTERTTKVADSMILYSGQQDNPTVGADVGVRGCHAGFEAKLRKWRFLVIPGPRISSA